MGYRRTLVVKHRNGSGRLQIVEDVATRLRSRHGLDAIVLEQNKGRLRCTNDGESCRSWVLSSFICQERRMVSRKLCTYQCENVGLHEG